MFWIYIPPIILVVALAGLAIMLGRKSAELKKINVDFPSPADEKEKTNWKIRFNYVGKRVIHLLEKILSLLKIIFRKTEQVMSIWLTKLRARRDEKKHENSLKEELWKDTSKKEKFFQEIEKVEKISANLTETEEKINYTASDVIIRKKFIDEPVIIQKKEPLPEDKARETALIYRIAENPRDIEAYREIGEYYMQIDNIKDAKEAFKMVLKLRPRDLKAKSSLREIEMRMRLRN